MRPMNAIKLSDLMAFMSTIARTVGNLMVGLSHGTDGMEVCYKHL